MSGGDCAREVLSYRSTQGCHGKVSTEMENGRVVECVGNTGFLCVGCDISLCDFFCVKVAGLNTFRVGAFDELLCNGRQRQFNLFLMNSAPADFGFGALRSNGLEVEAAWDTFSEQRHL